MARRKLIWARMAPAVTSLTTVANTVGGLVETNDLLQTFRTQAGITAGPVGLTIMRIRMQISLYLPATSFFGEIASVGGVYYGIKVVDLIDAQSQEVAEQPLRGPQLSPHDDWMTWGRAPVRAIPDTTGGAPGVPIAIGTTEVDVRSMRKLDELGQTLLLCLQSTSAAAGIGSAVPGVVASTSVLLALP